MALLFKICFCVSLMLSLYICSVIRAKNFKRDKQGVSFVKFLKASSVKLDTVRLADLKVSTLGECTLECLNQEECVSTNFGRTSNDEKYSCHLLSMDKFRRPDELVASDDFDYYHIEVSKTRMLTQPGAAWLTQPKGENQKSSLHYQSN